MQEFSYFSKQEDQIGHALWYLRYRRLLENANNIVKITGNFVLTMVDICFAEWYTGML